MARLSGVARRQAIASLDDAIERLGATGYDEVERTSQLSATLRSSAGRRGLRLELTHAGRIFGGNYALEFSSEEPILPATGGLSGRGRGFVQMRGVAFRASRGDRAGRQLADELVSNATLAGALGRVHFERVRVEPDGRPAIRHLGGSIVWIVFPPIVKKIPFVPEQVQATLDAFDAFAAAGRERSG